MVVDPRMVGWTSLPGTETPRPSHTILLERAGHSATAEGRDIYVIGGKNNTELCSSICKLDTVTGKWSNGFMQPPFAGKLYHSATLIKNEIWVVGGHNAKKPSNAVYVLNAKTLQWRHPTIRGDKRLLHRAAHGCVQHPLIPQALLLFGGFGKNVTSDSDQNTWLNDLVILNLDSLTVERVEPQGVPPTVRAYHTFSIMGNRCYAVGGRTGQETLIVGDEIVRVYDVAANQWTADVASGSFTARSNHKAVEVTKDQLIVTGGTGKFKSKTRDTQILKVESDGQMSWQRNALTPFEPARAGHGMVKCNDKLYVLGGYAPQQHYPADAWSLPVEAITRLPAHRRAVQPQHLEIAAGDQSARGEGSNWRSAKRSRPQGKAAQPEPPCKRQHALAPAGAVATAQPSGRHPCSAMQQAATAHGLPLPCGVAAHDNAAAERDAGGGCSLVPTSSAMMYRGCAFNDAAAMSATVTRLEAELAQAKASLKDRLANDECQLRQRNELETDVARLRSEVATAEQRCTASNQQCTHLQRLNAQQLHHQQAAEAATADANSKTAAAVATATELQQQLAAFARQRDDVLRQLNERQEACKAAEAEAMNARSSLRQERLDWERADAESRSVLTSLREEWRMLQDTNAQLHASVAKVTKSLQVSEEKVREGTAELAAARHSAAEEQQQSSKAMQAQQAATQAVQQQLQLAQECIANLEAAHKKSEAELTEFRSHAASLEQQQSQLQAKLKAAQDELKNVRSQAAHKQELYSASTKSLEREGQLLADRANELLKHIARQRSLSPNIADS